MEHRSNLARVLDRCKAAATPMQRGRLVIFETNALARSALARFFAPAYACVHACGCLHAAETALAVESGSFADLIISEHLPDDTSGCQVATGWRLRYPQLRRVVLATGSDALPEATASIDVVFRKPFNVQELGLFLSS